MQALNRYSVSRETRLAGPYDEPGQRAVLELSLAFGSGPTRVAVDLTLEQALALAALLTTQARVWLMDGVPTASPAEGRCTCGHPMSGHQTGEGPWSGFCERIDCDCERAERDPLT